MNSFFFAYLRTSPVLFLPGDFAGFLNRHWRSLVFPGGGCCLDLLSVCMATGVEVSAALHSVTALSSKALMTRRYCICTIHSEVCPLHGGFCIHVDSEVR